MNPNEQAPATAVKASGNIYTAVIAIAFAVVLVTALFVAYKCQVQYGTIFNIP